MGQIAPGRINRQFMGRVIENTFQSASVPAGLSGKTYMTDLLRSWVKAGCRIDQWEKNSPVMAKKLKDSFANWRPGYWHGRDGKLQPILMGASELEADAPQRANSDEALAYDLFAVFLFTAGGRVEVGTCGRCGSFYWNRWGHANKLYCGRKCSQRQTATNGQDKRLGAERSAKNRRIRQSIQNLISRKPQTTAWRRWTAKDAGVSLSYLTRAINRGAQGKPNGVKLTKRQMENLMRFDKGGE